MKDIVLVTISLNKMAGGLEKNIVWLANSLSKRKYAVTLLTFDLLESTSFYQIHQNVKWKKIGLSEAHKKLTIIKKIKTIFAIRKILKTKYNPVVIIFHHGLLARIIFASIGLKLKLICSERNALSLYKWVKKNKFNLNFNLLFFVNKITVQFEKYIKDYPFFLRRKIIVVANPVVSQMSKRNSRCLDVDITKSFTILNIGRLSSQKNQDVLIRQFQRLSSRYPAWNLYIVGNGELELYLKNLIDYLNLTERVFIIEPNSNIRDWYEKADIFCMPSRWEGFPNALAEALSFGIPSLGLSDCDGVNQLILNNQNGFLCDIDNISNYLEILILDESLRNRLSLNAQQIIEKYSPIEIENKWISIIEEI
jgi:GalNAc-alpha-(1->4)-GalNAc-alpha-(1->3)-diNAcBac-PP-undecaprenol alpha-1,4-N-acetyl-D-galactosaminyltransferase